MVRNLACSAKLGGGQLANRVGIIIPGHIMHTGILRTVSPVCQDGVSSLCYLTKTPRTTTKPTLTGHMNAWTSGTHTRPAEVALQKTLKADVTVHVL